MIAADSIFLALRSVPPRSAEFVGLRSAGDFRPAGPGDSPQRPSDERIAWFVASGAMARFFIAGTLFFTADFSISSAGFVLFDLRILRFGSRISVRAAGSAMTSEAPRERADG